MRGRARAGRGRAGSSGRHRARCREPGGEPDQAARPAPADTGDQPRPEERDGDGAHVAARDVGADGEAAPVGRGLLGQQAVAGRGRRAPPPPPPKTGPPRPSSPRRGTYRVSDAKLSCTIPDAKLLTPARTATAPIDTPNSSMILR